MWVYSPIDFTDKKGNPQPLKWGGKLYPVKRGINELPEDVGRAFFLYDLPDELMKEGNEATLELALRHALLRHRKTKNDADWLKGFICAKTREELESRVKDEQESKYPKGK